MKTKLIAYHARHPAVWSIIAPTSLLLCVPFAFIYDDERHPVLSVCLVLAAGGFFAWVILMTSKNIDVMRSRLNLR